LEALIPRTGAGSGLLEVDVDRIAPNPQQPRYVMDEAALGELVDSVRQHGVLQPLIVTRAESEADGFILVAGERRWRAARAAGLRMVPVVVKDATPRERLELALVENLQRQDLNPLEAAQAYRQLIDEHGLTQEAVAERVGRNRVTVANALRLLHLPPEARDALASGAITEGHARAVLACETAEHRQASLQAIVGQGLSVRQAEEGSPSTRKGSSSSCSMPLPGGGSKARGVGVGMAFWFAAGSSCASPSSMLRPVSDRAKRMPTTPIVRATATMATEGTIHRFSFLT